MSHLDYFWPCEQFGMFTPPRERKMEVDPLLKCFRSNVESGTTTGSIL